MPVGDQGGSGPVYFRGDVELGTAAGVGLIGSGHGTDRLGTAAGVGVLGTATGAGVLGTAAGTDRLGTGAGDPPAAWARVVTPTTPPRTAPAAARTVRLMPLTTPPGPARLSWPRRRPGRRLDRSVSERTVRSSWCSLHRTVVRFWRTNRDSRSARSWRS